MAETILETKELTRSFGALIAVNKVNISLEKGKITMLIGPNGSGKTTFLNTCTGVLKADSGKVIFKGIDITNWPPHKIYELGFVRTFQIPEPFKSLTVLDNLLVSIRNPGESPFKALLRRSWIPYEEERAERAMEILETVGLGDLWDKPAYTLGGAHLKMLEVSRALMTGAELIALDEPIGGVDPAYADHIFTHIKRLNREYGITFFVIEHRIDIAAPYADYAYAMDRGHIISQGKPNEVLNDPKVIKVYIGE